MKTISCAVLLWATLSWANDLPGIVGELKGTTKDGRFLVWEGSDGNDEENDTRTVVEDLTTGDQVVYWPTSEPKQLGPPELKKWLATHPLVAVVSGRNSPDKKRVADVALDLSTGSWSDDTFEADPQSGFHLVVAHDGLKEEVGLAYTGDSVNVSWTADGKHTLWVVYRRGHMVRDPGSSNLIIGTDGTTSVAVVAPREQLKTAQKVAEALSRAGFDVGSVAPAMKPRDKSVVFSDAAHTDLATKLAAAVPGGATVEKLTWRSNFDLVVSLGPGALK
jgi:hypothetical protein